MLDCETLSLSVFPLVIFILSSFLSLIVSSFPPIQTRLGIDIQNEDDHLLPDWAGSPCGLLRLYF